MRRRERRRRGQQLIVDPREVLERCEAFDGDRCRALVEALEVSLQHGAYDLAARVLERFPADYERHPALRARVGLAAAELFLALGDRERARAWVRRSGDTIELARRREGLLATLDERGPASTWLPDGRANFVRLDRALQSQELGAEELLDRLARRPGAWLREPQLHLLAFNALVRRAPERAARFLSRFLRIYSLPSCLIAQGEGNVLARLTFGRARRRHRGPLVSVVVAACDAESTVGYAIDSLLDQTYSPLEVLVCDDASTDRTPEILLRRYGKDPRVRLFRSVKRQGPYNVRNSMLSRARGTLLSFHDADDLAIPTRIALQAREMRRRSVVACMASWMRITTNGRIVFFRDHNALRASVVSLMMSRDAYQAVGPYRPARFGADLEVLERLRRAYGPERVRRLQVPALLGLWSEGSLTRRRGAEALEDGYRAPARRLYSELVFLQQFAKGPSEEEVARALESAGVCIEPQDVEALR